MSDRQTGGQKGGQANRRANKRRRQTGWMAGYHHHTMGSIFDTQGGGGREGREVCHGQGMGERPVRDMLDVCVHMMLVPGL